MYHRTPAHIRWYRLMEGQHPGHRNHIVKVCTGASKTVRNTDIELVPER
jgi:hypothetical protein